MLVDCAQQNSSGDAPPRRTRHHTGSPTACVSSRSWSRSSCRSRPPNTPRQSPSLLRRRSTFAPRFLRQARTWITSNTTPVTFHDFDHATRAGYAQAWFHLGRDRDISTMQRIHADAVSKSRAVATYVLFASNLVPLSQVYMVAYGHGTLEGPARSCAAARDRAALDPTCGDARVPYRSLSPLYVSRSTSSWRILPRDRSPALPRAAHPATLVGGTRSASPSRARRVSISHPRSTSSDTRTSLRSRPSRSTPC
jgi:hypothetical protein